MTVELGCCPGRPLLYTMCILGIVMSVAGIGVAKDKYSRVWAGSTVVYNAFFIFAARNKNLANLKFARLLALAVLILSILPLFFLPIMATSYITSGMLSQKYSNYYPDVDNEVISDTKYNFLTGSIFGFIIEVSIMLNVGWELIKFVLIHRFWKAAKEDEEVLPEIPGTPPVFYDFNGLDEHKDPGALPEKIAPHFAA